MNKKTEGQQAGTTQESAPATTLQPTHTLTRQEFIARSLEVVMAILLGVVAVTTAWSGYQAARWDGVQSARYTQAGALRVQSIRDLTLAGQASLYDVSLFNQWLNASSHGDTRLANMYERRFRPEFRPAFEAWLATNPFNDPNTPPGPLFMPQYKVSMAEKANQLETEADKAFEEGLAANERSDNYVLNTVFLATVLFFVAIAERFKWLPVLGVIVLLALALLLLGLYHIATYPIF